MRNDTRRAGFTLAELFIAILIIRVLLALILPAIQAAREAARREKCRNNLKNVVLAHQNYHDVYRMFPMGVMHSGPRSDADENEDAYLGPSMPRDERRHTVPLGEEREMPTRSIDPSENGGRPSE